MDKLLPTIVIVLVVILVFGSWALAWRSRRRRQAALGSIPAAPDSLGAPTESIDALYLATTRSDAPLERIAVDGLGFRARATVLVHPEGVVLDLAGRAAPAFLARERLVAAGRANWTIDRASGGDRLVFLRWRLGEGESALEVDSYLRAQDPAALLDALLPLVPAPAAAPASTEGDAP